MRRLHNLITAFSALALVAVLTVGGVLSYRLVRWQLTAEAYRQRLVELSDRYAQLQSTYNQAVRKTAVTELLVDDAQRVSVRIRNAAGTLRTIETPFSATSELYVDYVVLDGRLWIRRLFDASTAPGRGLLIDPALAEVDWNEPTAVHGKAVYRRLSPGRWVITVTGDGSLGLARHDGESEPSLAPPPEVRDYPPVEEQVQQQMQGVNLLDVLRSLTGF